eukprot:sb/3464147/
MDSVQVVEDCVALRLQASLRDLLDDREIPITKEEHRFIKLFIEVKDFHNKSVIMKTAKELELRMATFRIRTCLSDFMKIAAFMKVVSRDFSTKIWLENFVVKKLPPEGSHRDFEIAAEFFQEWLPPGHPLRELPAQCLESCPKTQFGPGSFYSKNDPGKKERQAEQQPELVRKIYSDCDYAGKDCSAGRSVRFLTDVNPLLTDVSPLVQFCKKHFEELLIPATVSPAKTLNIYVKDNAKIFETLKEQKDTIKECSAINQRVVEENLSTQVRSKKLHDRKEKHESEVEDLKQQIEQERNLRKFFKAEADKSAEGFKQLSVKLGKTQSLIEQEKTKKQNLEKTKKLSASCSCSHLKSLLEKKTEENKQQDITISSLSEALRKQTKAISAISRKTSSSAARSTMTAESLISATCLILSERQQREGGQIQSPSEMSEVCGSVTGDADNLFTMFSGMFKGKDKEGNEKRALFIINLLTYFCGGGESDPSGEELSEVL